MKWRCKHKGNKNDIICHIFITYECIFFSPSLISSKLLFSVGLKNIVKCHGGFLERKWWILFFLLTVCCHLCFPPPQENNWNCVWPFNTYLKLMHFCHTFPLEMVGNDNIYHTLCFSLALNHHLSAGQQNAINSSALGLAFCLGMAFVW